MKKPLETEAEIEFPQRKGSTPLIAIPPEVAEAILDNKKSERVIISFENGDELHRALRMNKDGFCFMTVGKGALKDLGLEMGSRLKIQIRKDDSKYGMPLPLELSEVFNQDPEGKARFEELKPGTQRSFLYHVGNAKSEEVRIQRALKMVENLKNGFISAGRYVRK